MDFTEETTPAGITLKIMFDHWKFLAFDKKGNSIYADQDGRTLLHNIPKITFLGNSFSLKKKYERDFELLKVRNDEIILPYYSGEDKKYLFIHENINIDLIPVIISEFESYSIMLKTFESGTEIDYLIIDNSISEIELSVVASKYKPNEIININKNQVKSDSESQPVSGSYANVNILSENPVFLAQIHLRNMELSKMNQILLDFEISAFDTQYIIFFVKDMLNKSENDPETEQNRLMLMDLLNSFEFYLALLEKDDETIYKKIDSQTDYKKLAPLRTLLSKVRDMTGDESNITYNEYENKILEYREKLINQEK